MAYDKTYWNVGDTVTAEKLNHAEGGIETNAIDIMNLKTGYNVIQEMVGSPLTASTLLEMSDPTKIYVYTGSEAFLVNGNWYYWDGNAWASGGVYNSVAVSTDKTLTIRNQAADAKSTGDMIIVNGASSEGTRINITTSNNDVTLAEESSLTYDEAIANYGLYSITTEDLESGTWSGAIKTANAKRIRSKHLLPVHAGMTIAWTVNDYDVFWNVVESETSTNWIYNAGSQWRTISGCDTIEDDGYLTLVFRLSSDTEATIDPLDFDGEVFIYPAFGAEDALENYNSIGYIDKLDPAQSNHGTVNYNGIKFVSRGRGDILLSGTASAATEARFYYNITALPDWMEIGRTYYVHVDSPLPTVKFGVSFYREGGTSPFFSLDFNEDGEFTVPAEAYGCKIRGFCSQGTAIDGTAHLKCNILKEPSNRYLRSKQDEDVDRIDSDIKGLINTTIDFSEGKNFSFTQSDLEQGSWAYTQKSNGNLTDYIRSKTLIPVKAGMIIEYSNPSPYELYFGNGMYMNSGSGTGFISSSWIPSGGDHALYIVPQDGYLTFIVRKEPRAAISVSEFNLNVVLRYRSEDLIGKTESTMGDITGNRLIEKTGYGCYITTNGNSISIVDGVPQVSSASADYNYSAVECMPGDTFTISGTGGISPRLWAFFDASGNICTENGSECRAYSSATLHNDFIIAPGSARWLIINTNKNNPDDHCYYGLLSSELLYATQFRLQYATDCATSGVYSMSSEDLESGSYSYTSKFNSASRFRIKYPIPVEDGMTVTYTVSSYDIYFLITDGFASRTAAREIGWKTGSGSFAISNDGYLVIVFRDHSGSSDPINPSDWDGTCVIETEQKKISGPGINLFDKGHANVYIGYPNYGDHEYSPIESNGKTVWIECKPNTTYTVSKTASARFTVAYGPNIPVSGELVDFTDSVHQNNNHPATSLTITTDANAKYLGAWVWAGDLDSGTVTFEEIIETVQIEEGDVATPYHPYQLTAIDHVAREKIGSLTDANLKDFNDYNVFTEFNTGTSTSNNVQYTVTKTRATAQRTASASLTGFYDLFADNAAIPSEMTPGETYWVSYEGTNITCNIYDRTSGSPVKLLGTTTGALLALPATITSMYIRLQVASTAMSVGESETVAIPKFIKLSDVKGIIPNQTDFDFILQPGIYFLNGTGSENYVHSPLPSGVSGTLEVFTGRSAVVQRVTRYSNGNIFVRTSNTSGSLTDRSWNAVTVTYDVTNNITNNSFTNTYNITCSPTIMTDTNQFIASTGDTTDRTGDIQTMLNSTGVCRLGPGDFYVTGVEVPTKAMLIGSGNATRLILANNVTNGYAVLLNNASTVKDIQIDGLMADTSIGNLPSTVGTRHAIVYQGTAESSSSEASTRKYYGSVENCYVHHFAGAALYLNKTGGQVNSNLLVSDIHIRNCHAGVDIANYSEYSRFANVSVTGCYYGCIDNGGNNNFANCSFSGNMIGILMDDTGGLSINNSHGTFSACTVCHSGTNNDGIAVKILGMDAGEIFDAMQIFYGSIIIEDSVGIRFIGANLGLGVPITVRNCSQLVAFSDCTIYGSSSSPFTGENNSLAPKFINCFRRDGTVYNPTL